MGPPPLAWSSPHHSAGEARPGVRTNERVAAIPCPSSGEPASGGYQGPSGLGLGSVSEKHGVRAVSQLEAFELQELGEAVATLLEIKNKCDAPLTFSIQIDFGDAQHKPSPEIVTEMNLELAKIRDELKLT